MICGAPVCLKQPGIKWRALLLNLFKVDLLPFPWGTSANMGPPQNGRETSIFACVCLPIVSLCGCVPHTIPLPPLPLSKWIVFNSAYHKAERSTEVFREAIREAQRDLWSASLPPMTGSQWRALLLTSFKVDLLPFPWGTSANMGPPQKGRKTPAFACVCLPVVSLCGFVPHTMPRPPQSLSQVDPIQFCVS